MKNKNTMLKEKIIAEYSNLTELTDSKINDFSINADTILDYSEYFFIRSRIYICFQDFSEYIRTDDKITDFLLRLDNASDYMTYIFLNGFAGDCDPKSVEGIIKLMIFSYNHAVYRKGKSDFILPVEVTL